MKTEEQLLIEMRRLAVLSQNHLVNIVRLRAMVQDRDEPIGTYLARLKGAAGVCNLTVNCGKFDKKTSTMLNVCQQNFHNVVHVITKPPQWGKYANKISTMWKLC